MKQYISFDRAREYEWLIIAQSYLQCALITARIIKNKKGKFATDEKSKREIFLKEIYGDYPQDAGYLIFPTIFNFKHGIELYLKTIIGVTNSEFPKNHDLQDLTESANIHDSGINEIVKKYSLSKLLLVDNTVIDKDNKFERYPQGSPYDSSKMYPIVDSTGKTVSEPKFSSFDEFSTWLLQNGYIIQDKIDTNKINELITDITMLHAGIRAITMRKLRME